MASYRRSLSPYQERNGLWEDRHDLGPKRDFSFNPQGSYYEEMDSVHPASNGYQNYLEEDSRERNKYTNDRDHSPDLIEHDRNYGYYETMGGTPPRRDTRRSKEDPRVLDSETSPETKEFFDSLEEYIRQQKELMKVDLDRERRYDVGDELFDLRRPPRLRDDKSRDHNADYRPRDYGIHYRSRDHDSDDVSRDPDVKYRSSGHDGDRRSGEHAGDELSRDHGGVVAYVDHPDDRCHLEDYSYRRSRSRNDGGYLDSMNPRHQDYHRERRRYEPYYQRGSGNEDMLYDYRDRHRRCTERELRRKIDAYDQRRSAYHSERERYRRGREPRHSDRQTESYSSRLSPSEVPTKSGVRSYVVEAPRGQERGESKCKRERRLSREEYQRLSYRQHQPKCSRSPGTSSKAHSRSKSPVKKSPPKRKIPMYELNATKRRKFDSNQAVSSKHRQTSNVALITREQFLSRDVFSTKDSDREPVGINTRNGDIACRDRESSCNPGESRDFRPELCESRAAVSELKSLTVSASTNTEGCTGSAKSTKSKKNDKSILESPSTVQKVPVEKCQQVHENHSKLTEEELETHSAQISSSITPEMNSESCAQKVSIASNGKSNSVTNGRTVRTSEGFKRKVSICGGRAPSPILGAVEKPKVELPADDLRLLIMLRRQRQNEETTILDENLVEGKDEVTFMSQTVHQGHVDEQRKGTSDNMVELSYSDPEGSANEDSAPPTPTSYVSRRVVMRRHVIVDYDHKNNPPQSMHQSFEIKKVKLDYHHKKNPSQTMYQSFGKEKIKLDDESPGNSNVLNEIISEGMANSPRRPLEEEDKTPPTVQCVDSVTNHSNELPRDNHPADESYQQINVTQEEHSHQFDHTPEVSSIVVENPSYLYGEDCKYSNPTEESYSEKQTLDNESPVRYELQKEENENGFQEFENLPETIDDLRSSSEIYDEEKESSSTREEALGQVMDHDYENVPITEQQTLENASQLYGYQLENIENEVSNQEDEHLKQTSNSVGESSHLNKGTHLPMNVHKDDKVGNESDIHEFDYLQETISNVKRSSSEEECEFVQSSEGRHLPITDHDHGNEQVKNEGDGEELEHLKETNNKLSGSSSEEEYESSQSNEGSHLQMTNYDYENDSLDNEVDSQDFDHHHETSTGIRSSSDEEHESSQSSKGAHLPVTGRNVENDKANQKVDGGEFEHLQRTSNDVRGSSSKLYEEEDKSSHSNKGAHLPKTDHDFGSERVQCIDKYYEGNRSVNHEYQRDYDDGDEIDDSPYSESETSCSSDYSSSSNSQQLDYESTEDDEMINENKLEISNGYDVIVALDSYNDDKMPLSLNSETDSSRNFENNPTVGKEDLLRKQEHAFEAHVPSFTSGNTHDNYNDNHEVTGIPDIQNENEDRISQNGAGKFVCEPSIVRNDPERLDKHPTDDKHEETNNCSVDSESVACHYGKVCALDSHDDDEGLLCEYSKHETSGSSEDQPVVSKYYGLIESTQDNHDDDDIAKSQHFNINTSSSLEHNPAVVTKDYGISTQDYQDEDDITKSQHFNINTSSCSEHDSAVATKYCGLIESTQDSHDDYDIQHSQHSELNNSSGSECDPAVASKDYGIISKGDNHGDDKIQNSHDSYLNKSSGSEYDPAVPTKDYGIICAQENHDDDDDIQNSHHSYLNKSSGSEYDPAVPTKDYDISTQENHDDDDIQNSHHAYLNKSSGSEYDLAVATRDYDLSVPGDHKEDDDEIKNLPNSDIKTSSALEHGPAVATKDYGISTQNSHDDCAIKKLSNSDLNKSSGSEYDPAVPTKDYGIISTQENNDGDIQTSQPSHLNKSSSSSKYDQAVGTEEFIQNDQQSSWEPGFSRIDASYQRENAHDYNENVSESHYDESCNDYDINSVQDVHNGSEIQTIQDSEQHENNTSEYDPSGRVLDLYQANNKVSSSYQYSYEEEYYTEYKESEYTDSKGSNFNHKENLYRGYVSNNDNDGALERHYSEQNGEYFDPREEHQYVEPRCKDDSHEAEPIREDENAYVNEECVEYHGDEEHDIVNQDCRGDHNQKVEVEDKYFSDYANYTEVAGNSYEVYYEYTEAKQFGTGIQERRFQYHHGGEQVVGYEEREQNDGTNNQNTPLQVPYDDTRYIENNYDKNRRGTLYIEENFAQQQNSYVYDNSDTMEMLNEQSEFGQGMNENSIQQQEFDEDNGLDNQERHYGNDHVEYGEQSIVQNQQMYDEKKYYEDNSINDECEQRNQYVNDGTKQRQELYEGDYEWEDRGGQHVFCEDINDGGQVGDNENYEHEEGTEQRQELCEEDYKCGERDEQHGFCEDINDGGQDGDDENYELEEGTEQEGFGNESGEYQRGFYASEENNLRSENYLNENSTCQINEQNGDEYDISDKDGKKLYYVEQNSFQDDETRKKLEYFESSELGPWEGVSEKFDSCDDDRSEGRENYPANQSELEDVSKNLPEDVHPQNIYNFESTEKYLEDKNDELSVLSCVQHKCDENVKKIVEHECDENVKKIVAAAGNNRREQQKCCTEVHVPPRTNGLDDDNGATVLLECVMLMCNKDIFKANAESLTFEMVLKEDGTVFDAAPEIYLSSDSSIKDICIYDCAELRAPSADGSNPINRDSQGDQTLENSSLDGNYLGEISNTMVPTSNEKYAAEEKMDCVEDEGSAGEQNLLKAESSSSHVITLQSTKKAVVNQKNIDVDDMGKDPPELQNTFRCTSNENYSVKHENLILEDNPNTLESSSDLETTVGSLEEPCASTDDNTSLETTKKEVTKDLSTTNDATETKQSLFERLAARNRSPENISEPKKQHKDFESLHSNQQKMLTRVETVETEQVCVIEMKNESSDDQDLMYVDEVQYFEGEQLIGKMEKLETIEDDSNLNTKKTSESSQDEIQGKEKDDSSSYNSRSKGTCLKSAVLTPKKNYFGLKSHSECGRCKKTVKVSSETLSKHNEKRKTNYNYQDSESSQNQYEDFSLSEGVVTATKNMKLIFGSTDEKISSDSEKSRTNPVDSRKEEESQGSKKSYSTGMITSDISQDTKIDGEVKRPQKTFNDVQTKQLNDPVIISSSSDLDTKHIKKSPRYKNSDMILKLRKEFMKCCHSDVTDESETDKTIQSSEHFTTSSLATSSLVLSDSCVSVQPEPYDPECPLYNPISLSDMSLETHSATTMCSPHNPASLSDMSLETQSTCSVGSNMPEHCHPKKLKPYDPENCLMNVDTFSELSGMSLDTPTSSTVAYTATDDADDTLVSIVGNDAEPYSPGTYSVLSLSGDESDPELFSYKYTEESSAPYNPESHCPIDMNMSSTSGNEADNEVSTEMSSPEISTNKRKAVSPNSGSKTECVVKKMRLESFIGYSNFSKGSSNDDTSDCLKNQKTSEAYNPESFVPLPKSATRKSSSKKNVLSVLRSKGGDDRPKRKVTIRKDKECTMEHKKYQSTKKAITSTSKSPAKGVEKECTSKGKQRTDSKRRECHKSSAVISVPGTHKCKAKKEEEVRKNVGHHNDDKVKKNTKTRYHSSKSNSKEKVNNKPRILSETDCKDTKPKGDKRNLKTSSLKKPKLSSESSAIIVVSSSGSDTVKQHRKPLAREDCGEEKFKKPSNDVGCKAASGKESSRKSAKVSSKTISASKSSCSHSRVKRTVRKEGCDTDSFFAVLKELKSKMKEFNSKPSEDVETKMTTETKKIAEEIHLLDEGHELLELALEESLKKSKLTKESCSSSVDDNKKSLEAGDNTKSNSSNLLPKKVDVNQKKMVEVEGDSLVSSHDTGKSDSTKSLSSSGTQETHKVSDMDCDKADYEKDKNESTMKCSKNEQLDSLISYQISTVRSDNDKGKTDELVLNSREEGRVDVIISAREFVSKGSSESGKEDISSVANKEKKDNTKSTESANEEDNHWMATTIDSCMVVTEVQEKYVNVNDVSSANEKRRNEGSECDGKEVQGIVDETAIVNVVCSAIEKEHKNKEDLRTNDKEIQDSTALKLHNREVSSDSPRANVVSSAIEKLHEDSDSVGKDILCTPAAELPNNDPKNTDSNVNSIDSVVEKDGKEKEEAIHKDYGQETPEVEGACKSGIEITNELIAFDAIRSLTNKTNNKVTSRHEESRQDSETSGRPVNDKPVKAIIASSPSKVDIRLTKIDRENYFLPREQCTNEKTENKTANGFDQGKKVSSIEEQPNKETGGGKNNENDNSVYHWSKDSQSNKGFEGNENENFDQVETFLAEDEEPNKERKVKEESHLDYHDPWKVDQLVCEAKMEKSDLKNFVCSKNNRSTDEQLETGKLDVENMELDQKKNEEKLIPNKDNRIENHKNQGKINANDDTEFCREVVSSLSDLKYDLDDQDIKIGPQKGNVNCNTEKINAKVVLSGNLKSNAKGRHVGDSDIDSNVKEKIDIKECKSETKNAVNGLNGNAMGQDDIINSHQEKGRYDSEGSVEGDSGKDLEHPMGKAVIVDSLQKNGRMNSNNEASTSNPIKSIAVNNSSEEHRHNQCDSKTPKKHPPVIATSVISGNMAHTTAIGDIIKNGKSSKGNEVLFEAPSSTVIVSFKDSTLEGNGNTRSNDKEDDKSSKNVVASFSTIEDNSLSGPDKSSQISLEEYIESQLQHGLGLPDTSISISLAEPSSSTKVSSSLLPSLSVITSNRTTSVPLSTSLSSLQHPFEAVSSSSTAESKRELSPSVSSRDEKGSCLSRTDLTGTAKTNSVEISSFNEGQRVEAQSSNREERTPTGEERPELNIMRSLRAEYERKMISILQKRVDVEKAYREECATIVNAVKALARKKKSMERELQDVLQSSLRDISQKYISELQRFVRHETI